MMQAKTTASFGYWMHRQRLALDLTQADLARRVGCATVTISKIERDERRPSRQMAGLLADRLAIPDTERELFLAIAAKDRAVDRIPLATQPLEILPSVSDETPRFSLPMPSTPFVGRRKELALLMARLTEPTCRLLSLVGPGGFGKTRLAVRLGEVALETDGLFPDGVYSVALEGLESPDLAAPAVAAALRFTFYEQRDPTSQLLSYLAGKQLLLILDSAEHFPAVSALVEEILSHAPRIKIVVTTREALKIRQEWFHPIEGMAAGDRDSDAVMLFQQCARRALPAFDLEHALVPVQRICELVDGAPLAIELAAGWVKVLPCERIVQEIERRLDFLDSTLHDVPARHRSMRIVLERSWAYLTTEEQQALSRLSVFTGGFGVEAAEQVAEVSLWTLVELVEKSVVQVKQDGRYRIHALLRQLGAEKLAGQPEQEAWTRAQHSAYYMAFLRGRCQAIAGREQLVALKELDAELDNIRGAWAYAAQQAQLEEFGAALPCLYRFLWTRGLYAEGEALTGLALAAFDRAALTEEQQRTWIALAARRAEFASLHGAHAQAQAQLAAALAAATQSGATRELALCHYVAGVIGDHVEDFDNARDHLQTALRIYRDLGDAMGIAETTVLLVDILSGGFNETQTGQELMDDLLPRLRAAGDLAATARALNTIGYLHLSAGEFAAAEESYREGLAIAHEVGDRLVAAKCIGGLGLAAMAYDDVDLAIRLVQEREASMRDLGHEVEVETSQHVLELIYILSGRYSEAREYLRAYPNRSPAVFTIYAISHHVMADEYAEMMRRLPNETAAKLTQGNLNDVHICLFAWAQLLSSDCELTREPGPSAEPIALTRPERTSKFVEILQLLCVDGHGCPLIPIWAKRQLAGLGVEAPKRGAASRQQIDLALEALAREMLTIRFA